MHIVVARGGPEGVAETDQSTGNGCSKTKNELSSEKKVAPGFQIVSV